MKVIPIYDAYDVNDALLGNMLTFGIEFCMSIFVVDYQFLIYQCASYVSYISYSIAETLILPFWRYIVPP